MKSFCVGSGLGAHSPRETPHKETDSAVPQLFPVLVLSKRKVIIVSLAPQRQAWLQD